MQRFYEFLRWFVGIPEVDTAVPSLGYRDFLGGLQEFLGSVRIGILCGSQELPKAMAILKALGGYRNSWGGLWVLAIRSVSFGLCSNKKENEPAKHAE